VPQLETYPLDNWGHFVIVRGLKFLKYIVIKCRRKECMALYLPSSIHVQGIMFNSHREILFLLSKVLKLNL
jgi:hypothetical protein